MNLLDAIQFLPSMPDSSLLYASSYSPVLVITSILIAIFGSYAALSVLPRIVQAERTNEKLVWILVGALAMGSVVWAMHFIGMLSLNLPCGIYYEPALTFASMIPAILASGMAAMRLQGLVRYDPTLFVLSILVAVTLAYVAMYVKAGLQTIGRGRDVLGAIIMGGAISGMHYTAMSAAYFIRGNAADILPSYFGTPHLAMAVIVLLSTVAIVVAIGYRNLEMVRREEHWEFALEESGYGVWDWNVQTEELLVSERWKEMLVMGSN